MIARATTVIAFADLQAGGVVAAPEAYVAALQTAAVRHRTG
jgi:hypothetical protein